MHAWDPESEIKQGQAKENMCTKLRKNRTHANEKRTVFYTKTGRNVYLVEVRIPGHGDYYSTSYLCKKYTLGESRSDEIKNPYLIGYRSKTKLVMRGNDLIEYEQTCKILTSCGDIRKTIYKTKWAYPDKPRLSARELEIRKNKEIKKVTENINDLFE